jgi:hypothetical protein
MRKFEPRRWRYILILFKFIGFEILKNIFNRTVVIYYITTLLSGDILFVTTMECTLHFSLFYITTEYRIPGTQKKKEDTEYKVKALCVPPFSTPFPLW